MEYNSSLAYEMKSDPNTKLYEFLATNYDISDLASKICAAKNAKLNMLSLRKIGNYSA